MVSKISMQNGSGGGTLKKATPTTVKSNLAANNQSTAPSNVAKNASYYGAKAPAPVSTVKKAAPVQVQTNTVSQPTVAPKPVAPVISDGMFAEIAKKAQSGVPLSQPTAEKQRIYDQFAQTNYSPTQQNGTPSGYLTESEVQQMLEQQANSFNQSLNNQSGMFDSYFGNLGEMLTGGMMQQQQGGLGEYETMFRGLQDQYNKLQEQIQYFQVLQQYWNMYGGQGGQNRQTSPFM